MFKVRKGNRILTVSETEKEFYLSEGYEVVELDEKTNDYIVTEKATGGRTYSVAEYNKVAEELEKLKKSGPNVKLEVTDFKEFKEVVAELKKVKAELAELKNEAVEPEKTKAKKESKGDSK